MDMFGLVAAFGGGLMGAYMGALPAFIMTGVLAMAGAVATVVGSDGGFVIGSLAFGPLMGPHVSFAGGVAAAAYAHRKGVLKAGNDIATALNGTGEPDVLIVGGVFGALGFVILNLIAQTPLGALTDQPGITVFILGCAARLIFGKTGLTGKYTGTGPRTWMTGGKGFVYNVVLGGGIGLAVSFIVATMKNAGMTDGAIGIFPIICFAFSAITLIFTQCGFAMPGTHHITLPSGLAAVVGVSAWGPSGAFLGVVFAILGSLLGDFFGNTFNSHCDSHIDPPATTIFLLTIAVSLIRISLLGA